MTTSPEQPNEWLALACCPDCGTPLERAESGWSCAGCGRAIESIHGVYNLLPREEALLNEHKFAEGESWKSRLVSKIYARHNRSAPIQAALKQVLGTLDQEGWGLNVGSSATRLHPRMLNLDLRRTGGVDLLGTAGQLPFQDDTLHCAVSQEVFEHLEDPHRACAEVARVLRPGGLFYLQIPFVIGVHSAPHDYWRFTDQGLRVLLQGAGFEILELKPAIGAGTALYRIAVEFCAAVGGSLTRSLYQPTKAVAAVLLAPLRWFDPLTRSDVPTNRIPAGYLAIARKPPG